MQVRIIERNKIILVPDNVGMEELARIIDEYSDEYTIYIGDEFNEDTDLEG